MSLAEIIRWATATALLILPAASGCAEPQRESPWSVRVIDSPGAGDLYRIGPDIYRGPQPTRQQFVELKRMGVKTVINLRTRHDDHALLAGVGLAYVDIPTPFWNDRLDSQAVEFLKVVCDEKRRPVFVHCDGGGDRTGAMIALYRLAVCGWTKQRAIEEMQEGHFHFHPIWWGMVRFLRRIDVAQLKRSAGVTSTQPCKPFVSPTPGAD